MFGDAQPPGYLLVADDVLGGFFALNGGSLGPQQGSVFYFAPEKLEWECCDLSYSQFLFWCLQGEVKKYYELFRWPGWEEEVSTVHGDQAISIYPPLWTKGRPLHERHHSVVSISEVFTLHVSGDSQ